MPKPEGYSRRSPGNSEKPLRDPLKLAGIAGDSPREVAMLLTTRPGLFLGDPTATRRLGGSRSGCVDRFRTPARLRADSHRGERITPNGKGEPGGMSVELLAHVKPCTTHSFGQRPAFEEAVVESVRKSTRDAVRNLEMGAEKSGGSRRNEPRRPAAEVDPGALRTSRRTGVEEDQRASAAQSFDPRETVRG